MSFDLNLHSIHTEKHNFEKKFFWGNFKKKFIIQGVLCKNFYLNEDAVFY